MRIFSFPPFADEKSKVLILGTMPGKISLSKQQYYAHPQNAFWKIMFALFSKTFEEDFKKRKALLLANGVAVWDVLKGCERESSADSDIKLEEPNDFESFFSRHSSIQHIFFNGNNPYLYYSKHLNQIPLPYTILPSTSPAHAVSFEKKLKQWRAVKKLIDKK